MTNLRKKEALPQIGQFFLIGSFVAIAIGAELLWNHLMLPQHKLSPGLTEGTYQLLITKWFLAGILLGMGLMFCLVETWIWRNWRSWNRFCCDHHERIYRATMDLRR